MTYRIAAAGGFWGDRNDALLAQVEGGPVDVVMLDYLAEVTMSILRVKKQRDPSQGFASDFLEALEPALPSIAERSIRVVTNAGGINPQACAQAVRELARRAGVKLRVGVVSGDDIFDQLAALEQRGVSFANLDTGQPLSTVRERVLSANVYLGAEPIARALREGADVVITGRCTDSALALGPLCAHFGWTDDDRLAAGTVVGHLLECGGQASGGNFAGGWREVPDLENLGYPIAEVEADGSFVMTKHAGLGGRVTPAVLKEQLVYEIGDPRRYVTPDVIADFTSISLEDLGADRVRISGVKGRPAPSDLKVSLSYEAGWRNVALMTFVWPDAIERARASAELLLARCRKLGLVIDAHRVELVGVDAVHGSMAPPPAEPPNEVLLRVAIRTRDRDSAVRFGREIAPLMLDGVPGAAGSPVVSGRPSPARIVDFWPALVPRDLIEPQVEVLE